MSNIPWCYLLSRTTIVLLFVGLFGFGAAGLP